MLFIIKLYATIYNIRSPSLISRRNALSVPRFRTCTDGERTFSSLGALVWTNLPRFLWPTKLHSSLTVPDRTHVTSIPFSCFLFLLLIQFTCLFFHGIEFTPTWGSIDRLFQFVSPPSHVSLYRKHLVFWNNEIIIKLNWADSLEWLHYVVSSVKYTRKIIYTRISTTAEVVSCNYTHCILCISLCLKIY